MKVSNFSVVVAALSLVSSFAVGLDELRERDSPVAILPASGSKFDTNLLAKRRGGGGGGGGGGRSSGGGSSGSSSSGSGSTGGSGGATSGGGSRGVGGSRSSPSYGGGRYYGGGAASAYPAGRRTSSGLLPFALVGGALAAAAIFPGLWLYGAYQYNYDHRYNFRNATNTTTNSNQSLPVVCLCEEYSACGCDDNDNATTAVLNDLIGDGSYNKLNKSLVTVTDVNGTRTIVLNGTLPNGTDTADASNDAATGQGISTKIMLMQSTGFWGLVSLVIATVYVL